MGGTYGKIFILFSFHNHFNLIASHTNSHTNTSIGLIANNNNNNAIRGLMNNITINNNNIIIYFSLILSNPTPLIRIAGLEPTPHVTKTRMLPLTPYPVIICHKNYNL